eukprot:665461-Karenia_brevis.AAC.1
MAAWQEEVNKNRHLWDRMSRYADVFVKMANSINRQYYSDLLDREVRLRTEYHRMVQALIDDDDDGDDDDDD